MLQVALTRSYDVSICNHLLLASSIHLQRLWEVVESSIMNVYTRGNTNGYILAEGSWGHHNSEIKSFFIFQYLFHRILTISTPEALQRKLFFWMLINKCNLILFPFVTFVLWRLFLLIHTTLSLSGCLESQQSINNISVFLCTSWSRTTFNTTYCTSASM